MNISKTKLPELTPRLPRTETASRPFSYPVKSTVHPTMLSPKKNKQVKEGLFSAVKSPEPISRKVQVPMSSSVTENSAFSDVSVSYDAEYDAFWDVADGSFGLKPNSS